MDSKLLESLMELGFTYGQKIVGALVLLVVALWLSNRCKNLVARGMQRAKMDETITRFASSLSRWAILVAAAVSLLGVFGVQTASFAAVIAAAGLAIGLAFQGTLSNFAAGVMLLVFRPFQVGQFIKAGGVAGTVDAIDLLTTTLDTPDARRIILPNSAVFSGTIENVSHHPRRRVDLTIGVSYDADLDQTKELLVQAARSIDVVDTEETPPVAVLVGLGASSVDFAVRSWVKTEDYWAAHEQLLRAIKITLDAAKIGIPYPQMDVHVNMEQALNLQPNLNGGEVHPN